MTIFPKFKVAGRSKDAVHFFHDLTSADGTRVGDVIGAHGRALFPEVEAGADKVASMRERIQVVLCFDGSLHLSEEISRVIIFVKRKPKPPEIGRAEAAGSFFAAGFGAAKKGAGRRMEGEIRFVEFGEAIETLGLRFKEIKKPGLCQVSFDPG